MRNTKLGLTALVGYIATIYAANYALGHIGDSQPFGPHTLPVWPGLAAPSGVYFVALALVLRNVVQRQLGRVVAVAAIVVGAGLSYFTAPSFAVASGVAFLCSEALDMSIYTPLRKWLEGRGLTSVQVAEAVLPAALAGGALDSAVFLKIAFHGESFWWPQVVGKTWGVLAATAILAAVPWLTDRFGPMPEVVPA